MPAPIIVFAYNRPRHLRMALEALAANELAEQSELVIYCDGPKPGGDPAPVLETRRAARQAGGFASVAVVEREGNQGLAQSVISGVKEQIEKYGRVIVLEDDLIASPHFLRYMNDALDLYADEEKVGCIHAWLFDHGLPQPPESFFLRGGDCWGWATWARAWKLFDADSGKLISEIQRRGLARRFTCDGAYDYLRLLELDREGKISSWAVRWHASLFLADAYTLYPGRSLVRNCGQDGSGTHCGDEALPAAPLAESPIRLARQAVEDHPAMYRACVELYRSWQKTQRKPGLFGKLRQRLSPAWWRERPARGRRRQERDTS